MKWVKGKLQGLALQTKIFPVQWSVRKGGNWDQELPE